jgi:hypothetical protein
MFSEAVRSDGWMFDGLDAPCREDLRDVLTPGWWTREVRLENGVHGFSRKDWFESRPAL